MKTRSKWLATVLCVVLIVSLALFAVSCKKGGDSATGDESASSQEPAGSVTGLYYCDAADGECTLSLNGNSYVLSFATDYKVGSFTTADGKTLTLSVDGTAVTANIAGDELSMTLQGKYYVFLQKIARKVTFSVEGKTEEVVVINGKTAGKPEDPASTEAKKFVGWYTSESYDEAYNFASPVREDVTVYARFAAVDRDVREFRATLVSDGEKVAVLETIGGVLYELPVLAAKDGKEFDGWYTSDFGTAEKLGGLYNGQVLKENTSLYAVWKDGVSGVRVAEDKISWNAIGAGAQSFTVTITAPDGQKSVSNVSTTEWKYDFAKGAAGEYEITIENRNGGEKATVYKKNKALARVSDFNVIEPAGILTYNKVENAEKYYITVKCGNEDHNHTEYDNGNSSYYDISGCDMTAGGILVTVRATRRGYMESVSETFVYDRMLDSVKGVEVNEKGELVWYRVAGATSYTVVVNGKEIDAGDVTEYSLKYYGAGEYEVGVYPVTKGYNSPAATMITYRKTTLAAPGGLTVAGDTVTWNEVEGAKGYAVKVNGTISEVSGNSYKLTEDQLANASSIALVVYAKGATAAENSADSDICTLGKYSLDYIEYRNGTVYWNPVYVAKGYRVSLNGEDLADYAAGVTSADIVFSQKGKNTITVSFLYDEDTVGGGNTTEVTVYAVIYNANGGTKIENDYAAVGDEVSFPDAEYAGYEFVGWYDVPNGGENNGKKISSGKLTKAADLYLYAYFVPKRYTVTLDTANGGTIDNETATVSFGKEYTLPVPESSDESKVFGGWYSEPNGAGIQYTNNEGKSVSNWSYAGDVTVFAYWVDLFTYELNGSGNGYIALSGPGISYVVSAKVPATYNEKPVTNVGILTDVTKLISISIPDTAAIDTGSEQGVSSSSFQKASNLQTIEVYTTGNEPTPRYKSVDGALYRMTYTEDGTVSNTALYLVPLGKTGDFRIADGTNEIANYAMYRAKFTKIVIPASVGNIGTAAMSSCYNLLEVECLPDEENDGSPVLTLAASVFKSSSKIEKLTLRASLAESKYEEKDATTGETKKLNFDPTILNSCSNLENIEFVGAAKGAYSAYNGILCNAAGTEVIYCPRGKSGKVVLDGTLTAVAEESFKSCRYISELVIPGEIVTIGKNAFASCTGLSNLSFTGDKNDMPLSIGEKAFYGCTGLNTLTLPENLKTLSKYAFGETKNLDTVTVLSNGAGSGIDFVNAAFGSAPTSTSPAYFTSTYYVKYITLGKAVPEINIAGVFGSKIESLSVDPENQYYYADESGVLYDKKVENVIYYPLTKAGAYEIPGTVTAIGAGVFRENKAITAVTIPASVKTIGEEAFYGCSSLTSVIFEDGETELKIGDFAFRSCKVTELVLPSRLRSAGMYAFASCSSLTRVEIKEGIEILGDYAFNADSKLTEIVLPASLRQMGEYDAAGKLTAMNVFLGCSAIENITVAEGNESYVTVSGVLYLKTAGVVTDLFYCPVLSGGDGGKIVIPATVTKVWDKAFNNNKNITSITFEKGEAHEVSFGSLVFTGAVNLTEIELPEGMKTIGRNLFYSATGLKTIRIPSTITTIEAQAFYSATNLKTVTFAEGGTEPLTINDAISDDGKKSGATYSPFYGCKNLSEVILPERTVYIGSYAFSVSAEGDHGEAPSGKSELTHVYIPAAVETIGEYLFKYADKLTTVEIGKGSKLKEIPGGMFYNCISLTSFAIPEGVTTIGYYAFYRSGITSVELPEGLTEIGATAFGYTKLTSVFIPKTVTRLGGKMSGTSSTISGSSFSGCSALETVTFEAGSELTSLEGSAFSSCSKLAAIELPDKLTNIGSNAFSSTAITSVVIPASVKTIGANAFSGCSNLAEITFAEGSQLEGIGNSAFSGTKIESFAFPESSASKLTLGTTLFNNCKNLKRIHISSVVTAVTDVFKGCTSIEEITIDEGNQNFSVKGDGILYNKLGTAIRFVIGELSGDYKIPEGIQEIDSYAFQGQAGMTKVTIPSSVVTIGNYAFSQCWNLKEVEFAKGMTGLKTIPQYMFNYCGSLTKIEIPASVTKIDQYAFNYCYDLTSVTFEEGSKLTTLEKCVFKDTPSLDRVELPSGLQTIGTNVFQDSGITSVVIPESVKSIGGSAFASSNLSSVTFVDEGGKTAITFGSSVFKATKLTSVRIPARVTALGANMFQDCTELKSVEFATTKLTEIAAYAFSGCSSLKSISIPEGVKTIQNYAFADCTALSEVKLPDSLTTIATPSSPTSATSSTAYKSYAFSGCTSLTSIEIPKNVTFIGTHAFDGAGLVKVVLPLNLKYLTSRPILPSKGATAFTTTTSSTAANATTLTATFANCANLTEVILPAGLEAIGSRVFMNCPKLTKITYVGYAGGGNALPKTTTEILAQAFDGTGINNLTVEGLTKIYQYAFYGAKNLKVLNLPKDAAVKSIGQYAFANCTGLESVILPAAVETIEKYAFSGCSSLKTIELPSATTSLGDYAFTNCTALEKIELPAGVKTLGGSAFSGCVSLADVTLSSVLTSIGASAFSHCESLAGITLPAGLNTLASKAFEYSGLTSIDLTNISSLGSSVFTDCESLESVTLGDKLTSIPASAFYHCRQLSLVNIPSNVTTIGADAFAGTALTSVELSANVTSIGRNAFSTMYSLQTIEVDPANAAYYSEDDCLYTAQNALLAVPFGKTFENDTFVLSEGKTLEGYVFNGCNSIKVVDLSKTGMTELSEYAFTYLNSVEKIILPDTLTTIGQYAFWHCVSLKEIVLPDGLIEIGQYAFRDCTSLEKISIPDSVTDIKQRAFTGTSSLVSVTIPYAEGMTVANYLFENSGIQSVTFAEGWEVIAPYTFDGCSKLVEVNLPSSLTIIGQYAFRNCTSLEAIDIPANVEKIGSTTTANYIGATTGFSFAGCTSLKTVNFLGDDLIAIGSSTFQDATSLTSIDLPGSLQVIGNNSFKNSGITSIAIKGDYVGTNLFDGCASLGTVTIADGVTTIPDGMFRYASALTSVTIPSSVVKVGTNAFLESGLRSVTVLSETITFSSSVFKNCKDLVSVTMPADAAAKLGNYMFQGCSSLTSLKFSSGTAEIPTSCFEESGITEIEIPSTLGIVGASAFKNCTALRKITLAEGVTTVRASVFTGCTSLTSVVIPSTVSTLFSAFEGWTPAQTVYFCGSPYKFGLLWNGTWQSKCEANIVWNYEV